MDVKAVSKKRLWATSFELKSDNRVSLIIGVDYHPEMSKEEIFEILKRGITTAFLPYKNTQNSISVDDLELIEISCNK